MKLWLQGAGVKKAYDRRHCAIGTDVCVGVLVRRIDSRHCPGLPRRPAIGMLTLGSKVMSRSCNAMAARCLVGMVGLLVLSCLPACSPITVIKRSAYVPMPQAALTSGAPLGEGKLELAGTWSSNLLGFYGTLEGLFSDVGDAGLLVPTDQLGGSIRYGVTDGFELAAGFGWSRLSWARPNTVGVLPLQLPGSTPQWLGGAGVRFNRRIGTSPWTFEWHADAVRTTIAQAVYVCPACVQAQQQGRDPWDLRFETGTSGGLYELDRIDRTSVGLLGAGFGFNAQLSRRASLLMSWDLRQGVSNDGFDDDISRRDDHTIETYPMVTMSLGLSIRGKGWFADFGWMWTGEDELGIEFDGTLKLRIGALL